MLLGGVTAAAATPSSGARATPVVGPDFRVSGPAATAYEDDADVAYSTAAGEYLVVWRDSRNFGTRSWDIYGRRVEADGTPIGADFLISGPGATETEWRPSVAYNSADDEYLVVWGDARQSATRGDDVYGRRVKGDGTPIGADFRISGPGAIADDLTPVVAYNSVAHEYLVVWADLRSFDGRKEDIYARRVKADGTPTGVDTRICGPKATEGEWEPAVAYNPAANQYLVVWADSRNPTRGWDIYGRRVTAEGAPTGGELRISGTGAKGTDLYPALAYNPSADEYLVIWQDQRKTPTRGTDIFGRRVSGDGVLAGADFRISSSTSEEWMPDVAFSPAEDRYLVLWEDQRTFASRGNEIYGRRVSGDGVPLERDFRVSGPKATGDERKVAVAYNPADDQHLAVWVDGRGGPARQDDIFGRRLEG